MVLPRLAPAAVNVPVPAWRHACRRQPLPPTTLHRALVVRCIALQALAAVHAKLAGACQSPPEEPCESSGPGASPGGGASEAGGDPSPAAAGVARLFITGPHPHLPRVPGMTEDTLDRAAAMGPEEFVAAWVDHAGAFK